MPGLGPPRLATVTLVQPLAGATAYRWNTSPVWTSPMIRVTDVADCSADSSSDHVTSKKSALRASHVAKSSEPSALIRAATRFTEEHPASVTPKARRAVTPTKRSVRLTGSL